jgi:hypothetical protein
MEPLHSETAGKKRLKADLYLSFGLKWSTTYEQVTLRRMTVRHGSRRQAG